MSSDKARSRPSAASLEDHGGSVTKYTAFPLDPATIPQAGWAVLSGEISLADLPPFLFEFWCIAEASVRQELNSQLTAARLEADRLWLENFGDKDRREYLLSRLDDAFEATNSPFVADLTDEAWRIYCQSLTNIREAVRAHA